jgi:hypothetical protein
VGIDARLLGLPASGGLAVSGREHLCPCWGSRTRLIAAVATILASFGRSLLVTGEISG